MNELPESYWIHRCPETPGIDMVLEFFKLREDRHGKALFDIFGTPVQHAKGWWRLPNTARWSPNRAPGGDWHIAWHGTNFKCIYSITAGVDLSWRIVRSSWASPPIYIQQWGFKAAGKWPRMVMKHFLTVRGCGLKVVFIILPPFVNLPHPPSQTVSDLRMVIAQFHIVAVCMPEMLFINLPPLLINTNGYSIIRSW